ncbi:hypothetical protein R69658_07890 [Paraburkholderia aspalathi]|uniref:Uncharacterized protein n=2 Tax=Paraburkholderia aspalathi TaxID=1324617 RepID=A0ABM8T7Z3_9BURK|nr:hypothetical protein R69658_07890 [Paraburkholderia aspalathi]
MGKGNEVSAGRAAQMSTSSAGALDSGAKLTNPEADDYISGFGEYTCTQSDSCPRKDLKSNRPLSITHRQAPTGSFNARNPYNVQVFRSPW